MRVWKILAKRKRIVDARAQWMQDHLWLHWRVLREALRSSRSIIHPLIFLWGLA